MELQLYAGIGSRKADQQKLKIATGIAKLLSEHWLLRSGGAIGMDTAFEQGAKHKEILRPKDATPEAIELASKYHPAWDQCNDYVRKLMGRNAQIILGRDLQTPVEFVLYWCPNENHGGTSQGLRIARDHGIRTIKL